MSDLTSVRRIALVAFVWAVAASAIAVVAILDVRGGEAEDRADDAQAAVVQTRVRLERRIDRLERKLGGFSSAEDLSRLDQRLKEAEDTAGRAEDTAGAKDETLKNLDKRLKKLEESEKP